MNAANENFHFAPLNRNNAAVRKLKNIFNTFDRTFQSGRICSKCPSRVALVDSHASWLDASMIEVQGSACCCQQASYVRFLADHPVRCFDCLNPSKERVIIGQPWHMFCIFLPEPKTACGSILAAIESTPCSARASARLLRIGALHSHTRGMT